ncbi:hypothetical protein RZE82_02275 [Mollicutes bacterium LVI A0039]|nr:hypothetical protein RZE82_02275 [Mollicutes bacterium LVI A0039]
MSTFTFKTSIDDRGIIDTNNILTDLGIVDQIVEAYADEEDITSYTFINDNGDEFEIFLTKYNQDYEYYKVIHLNDDVYKKGKYSKVEIKRKEIERIVSDVGFVNAQRLHAEDHHEYAYMPLRQYLKKHPNQFKKTFIYERGFDDEYRILRHKNLFSKYQDEISDFERLTTIERYEPKSLKISYELDEEVFDFDGSQMTIQERKFLREFAKDIYTKKNRYTERELFEILSGRDLYIQVVTVTPKEHKDVWSKVELEDMDIRILEKNRSEFQKQNTPQHKKRKYLSKKQQTRKTRRVAERQSSKALKEYFELS